jgi:hypothetical protein
MRIRTEGGAAHGQGHGLSLQQLRDKIAALRRQMQFLMEMRKRVEAAPDGQISLTDPDARSMATSGRGTGIVCHNDG